MELHRRGGSGSTWTKPCPSTAMTTKNPTGTRMSSQYFQYSTSGGSDDRQPSSKNTSIVPLYRTFAQLTLIRIITNHSQDTVRNHCKAVNLQTQNAQINCG